MPSLSPYLERCGAGDPTYLAWVVCIYSIGEMVGSLLFGALYNHAVLRSRTQGPRLVLCVVILTGIAGSVMYLLGDILKIPSLVFWARLMQGLWTGGQQSVEQAYLAFAAKPGERTELTSRLGTFAVLGFILGPAFGAMFTTVNFRIEAVNLTVDPYTAPGIFILFIGFAMFIATSNYFNPSAVSGRELAGHSSKSSLEALNGSVDGEDSETTGLLPNNNNNNLPKPSTTAITSLLIMFFVHFYSFAVQETITTPLVLNLYQFEQYQVNLLFIGVGVLSLFTSAAVGFLSRFFSDRAMLVLSLVLGLVGSLLLIDSSEEFLPLPRFFLGFAIITVAFPFGRNVTISIFSAVLGEVEQGFYMGLMLAVGAIPRALGPFWAILSLKLAADEDTGMYHTWLEFGTSSFLFVASLLLVIPTFNTLVPFEDFYFFVDSDDLDVEGQGVSGAGTAKSPKHTMTPIKVGERRNSLRPSTVAQIQGEFDSAQNLTGLIGSSFGSAKKSDFGGRRGKTVPEDSEQFKIKNLDTGDVHDVRGVDVGYGSVE
ncbi:hypothetical protein TrST_g8949 [Triparma strigata]|nr:hypothetical protein TrST_g8949 [Triparma strigata]